MDIESGLKEEFLHLRTILPLNINSFANFSFQNTI